MLEAPDPAGRGAAEEDERPVSRKDEGWAASYPDPAPEHEQRPGHAQHYQW